MAEFRDSRAKSEARLRLCKGKLHQLKATLLELEVDAENTDGTTDDDGGNSSDDDINCQNDGAFGDDDTVARRSSGVFSDPLSD